MLLCALWLGACSPTLNWREVRPQGSGAEALFPCKPSYESRPVELAGSTVGMTLYACDAGGTTWALAFADVGDPARVSPALLHLGVAAAGNLKAPIGNGRRLDVPGMTPNPQALRFAYSGARADGAAVRSHVALFSKGTRVYQATVVGPAPPDEAVETFFAALRVPS